MTPPELLSAFAVDWPASLPWTARIVRIPPGLRQKFGLLAELSHRLRLPDYFGWNWDALEECLCDLSWLGTGPVVLIHEDIPFEPGSDDQQIYLEILRNAAERTGATDGPRLIVTFPSAT